MRFPHFLKLTTSKTKQFGETSFKNGKLSAELTASYQCVLRFFDSTYLNYCACHEKVIPGHAKCCPDLPTALMNMSLAQRLPRKMHLCRSSSNVPRLPSFLEMPRNPDVLLIFGKVHTPVRLPRETTSERPKVVPACGVFHILTSKCASRHNGVHFLNISTSKSGPELVCFIHFDFDMCFAPQSRALFRHRNFQKWSGPGVSCTF